MTDTTVAKTILEQLGGRRFIMMTGAKNITAQPNALTFRIPLKTRDKSNYVEIRLNVMDTYDMKFMWIHGFVVKTRTERDGVYNDQLQAVFTEVTGLETSLGTMGRI